MGKNKAQRGSGLGRLIIKDRFRGKRKAAESFLHTSEINDGYDWGRLNLKSVTDQNQLDDFLATAELAGTEFTAEKLNVKIVSEERRPALPSAAELASLKQKQDQHRDLLRIPRRPAWNASTTAEELDHMERESFLNWRRELSQLQDTENLLITPYERNLEFWRQLWRVIERSDIVVQIVDGRNPMLFYCKDLEKYVSEINQNKRTVILVNKSDLLTETQRQYWADYFTQHNTKVLFWSALIEQQKIDAAASAARGNADNRSGSLTEQCDDVSSGSDTGANAGDDHMQEAEISGDDDDQSCNSDGSCSGDSDDSEQHESCSDVDDEKRLAGSMAAVVGLSDSAVAGDKPTVVAASERCAAVAAGGSKPASAATSPLSAGTAGMSAPSNQPGSSLHPTSSLPAVSARLIVTNDSKLLGVDDLIDALRAFAPPVLGHSGILTVGLVGYPNVGKSLTINALLRAKKVSVSATPGKTKHFQTLYLDPTLVLCDCPGLVMPSFVSTKSEMIVNGILPIDQMRDHWAPVALVCHRIPRRTLEVLYGICIPKPGEGEDPDRPPTAEELLNAYGYVRGYMTSNGVPDRPRTARVVLKDYVSGKLLYCHPPPDVNEVEYGSAPGAVLKHDQLVSTLPAANHDQQAAMISSIDSEFFRTITPAAHVKGNVKPSTSTVTKDSGHDDSSAFKSWKKHGNRNKKEKARRMYSHHDKHDGF